MSVMMLKVCVLVLLIDMRVSMDLLVKIRRKRQDRLVGFKKNDYVPRTTEFWLPPEDDITKDNYIVPTVPVIHTDPCEPYEYKKPAFFDPERRVSEVKCYEFIWEMKVLKEVTRRAKECIDTRREGPKPVSKIGGKDGYNEYPHMVAIGWRTTNGTLAFKCGGTLISHNYVLTSAHCYNLVDSSLADPNPKIVRLGVKNLKQESNDGNTARDVEIKHIILHPGFSSPMKYNDIALLHLKDNVEFTNNILPACLWSTLNVTTPDIKLTGFGTLERGTKTSRDLEGVDVDIIDSKLCDQLLKPYCNTNWCGVQKQICAGKLAGGADSCQGDLGGPLQVKVNLPVDQVTMHYVIGVTSFGIGCARPNTPAVYTRVSSFVEWIESVVWPS